MSDSTDTNTATDPWAEWILRRRDAGTEGGALTHLGPVRDAVLEGAALAAGETLVDVGCGDGMIGMAALPLVGDDGRVVFTDVSPRVVDACREAVDTAGRHAARASFVVTSAEDLDGVEDSSADSVTTRSVLIYVERKERAFAAFHRVLRPGGRISLWEPLNCYDHPERDGRLLGYEVGAVRDLAERVRAVYDERQPAATDPMMNFDERDLLAIAWRVGFRDLHLSLRIEDRAPRPVEDWEGFLASSPNPLAPTLAEAVESSLDPSEAERFLAHLRRPAERGEGLYRHAAARLVGTKR
jgi:arsenite methyltransferase